MNSTNDVSQEYLKSTVMTAAPEQLQLMLLDGAIRFATRAIEAIREKDIEASFNALQRAQRIAVELRAGLRREVAPEIVDQMSGLYNFIYRRLVDGSMNRDVQAIEDALKILRHQRETWTLLIEKLAKEQASQTPQQPDGQKSVDPDERPTSTLSLEG